MLERPSLPVVRHRALLFLCFSLVSALLPLFLYISITSRLLLLSLSFLIVGSLKISCMFCGLITTVGRGQMRGEGGG